MKKILNRKPTVLIIIISFRPNVGGAETHLEDLCEYLVKNRYKVYVITYQPTATKVRGKVVEKRDNMEIHRIPWFGHLYQKLEPYSLLEFTYLAPMLLLYSLFFMFKHKKKVDVIHAHGFIAAFVAKFLVRIFKRRSIVSTHTIYELPKKPLLSKLARLTLSSFDVILALSKPSKMELVDVGLSEKRVRLYTSWVNQTLFRPLDKKKCKERLGWANKFIVLFVGRLIEVKGVRLLIEVAKRFSCINENIYFAFVGDGPLEDEVKVASNELENVIYVGRVNNKRMNLYYNASDVTIVPSLCEEGFGRVTLEALSCGVPVIASNRGGIPEALDQLPELLIEPTADKIEDKIRYFYDHSTKLVSLARNCRKYAEKCFSEKNAIAIEESYVRCR